ncbi:Arrestin or S-antigen, domain-containing protein [Cladophialophora immunda]|nr:Arrestin or S-antigen, domain-containing protein [Cladophialophora immunda]
MGLTKAENSPGLSFEFNNTRQHYSPGDVISGRVILNTAADSAIGKLVVSFWGRAKSRIIQQHGQTVTYHRGRTQLFKKELLLYEGQYTHKPGSFSWPFEFVVPEHAEATSILSGERWKPKDHYRATTDENNLDLTLPPSCYHRRHMFGRQAECFIEYVLDATLTEPEGLHHIRGPQSKVSSYPIVFHPLSTPEPIENYSLTTDQRLFTISTLKLLPEHAGTSLGFRDRARSIFQRDSIPRFSFSLAVQAPGIIQLFHPNHIPFLITATPDLSPENTTIDTSTSLPTVILRSAKIELKTHVRCRAAGTFADSKTYEIPVLPSKALNHPLIMTHGTTTASEATLDLGKLCDLHLGNAKLGSRLETPMCPNFTTYNVSRSYQLLWELEIECAEKTEKFSSVKNGPEIAIILPPATVRVESELDGNLLLGGDLMQALSTESTGSGSSSGFWSRRSHEGRAAGEKEKAKFGPPSPSSIGAGIGALGIGGGKKPNKSKAEEAAEDRARARLEAVQASYQGRHQISSTRGRDDSHDAVADAYLPTTNPSLPETTGPATATITVTDTDADQQLPRYVP